MADNKFTAALRARFQAMEPKQRENTIKAVLVVGGILILVGFYYLSGQSDKKPPPPKEKLAVLELGESRLQDDVRAQVEKERQEQQSQNKVQDKTLAEQRAQIEKQEAQLAALQQAVGALAGNPGLGLPDSAALGSAPADPAAWENGAGRAPRGAAANPEGYESGPVAPIPVEYVGGVGKGRQAEGAPNTRKAGEGKGNKRFFLPTSFMPAKLLTGLKAKTVESARGEPEPMLLRIQAPAVLPNEVRAALEGCLVVAHGYGSLASERIEARLVSLSCLDYEGKSLIEAELHGIVVDKDGVKGLAGHPVSKMGANLARLALANAVSGAGEAFEAASVTTNTSVLGQTQTVDADKVGKAGLGKGISRGSDEYAKIIADLVRQQSPVIEVGPSKDVTVVVTEGVWLELKAYEDTK